MSATATLRQHRGHQFRNAKLAKQAAEQLRTLIARFDPKQAYGLKLAAIGGDPESSFEQAFASLAYTYIADKAPRLLEYMLGFQLVDRNEDNTKAIGIFGFKIGNQLVYAPVFFLNGDLKGHELLYLKAQDMFVPMKENWVNYVLAKRPHVLGQGSSRNLQQLGVMQPDIRSLSIPPHNSKYGSAAPGWPEWAEDFAPLFGSLTTENQWRLEKYAGLDDRLSLPVLLRSNLRLCKLACDVYQKYPLIKEAMDRFYGPDLLPNSLRALRQAVTKQSSAALSIKHKAPSANILGVSKRAATDEKVKIVVHDSVTLTANGAGLTESEQQKLLRDGHLIKDHRDGEEVSKAYNTQIEMALVNPDASGLYEVLVKPGEFTQCLVISDPHSNDGRKPFSTVIRTSPKNWLNAHRTTIFARPSTKTREDFEKWFESQSNSTPSDGGTYIAVSKRGEGSVPFRVREKVGDGRYKVRFEDYADRRRPGYLPATDTTEYHGDSDYYYQGEFIELNQNSGSSFRSLQGALYIPADAKIISLKEPKKPKEHDSDEPCCVSDSYPGSSESPIELGNLADIQLELFKKVAQLKLYCDGNEMSINSSPLMSKRAGLFALVKNHGFREGTARSLIKDAEVSRLRGKAANFFVKYANPYAQMVGQGPSAPMIPDAQMGFESDYGGVPAQYPETYYEQAPELDSGLTDPSVYDPRPEATADPMAMQFAQQAGQSGQKEVFDTAMISGLLKAVRQDSMVDRYMGDLFKALDRVGRMIFMFYWHSEEFQDRYGKADMPELEDTLRNVFEGIGDLVLFLKEKDVDMLPGSQLGSPNIDQTAGN